MTHSRAFTMTLLATHPLPRRPQAPQARAAPPARPGDPRPPDRVLLDHRRAHRRQPRRGGAEPRPALRVRLPGRQDRLGRGPPGLRLEAPHRPERAVPDAAPARRHLRLPQAGRERARPVRRGARRHRGVGRVRHGHRARPQGRAPQGRGDRGRRRPHLRALLRGDEQRRPLRPRHHHHRQRQRHEHLAQRGRDQQDARPDRGGPAHQPAAGEDQGHDVRARRRLRRGRGGLREERRGERQESVLAGDALRGARIPLLRPDRRARSRQALRHAAVRARDAGPAGDPRDDAEGKGLLLRRGEPGEVARTRGVRSGHR